MDSVSGIVSDMTGCISYSNEMSSRMLSKYEESMTNINDIEKTVEALMCELGIGGFMGVEDIMPGMKVQITMDGASAEVYHGEVEKQKDDRIEVNLPKLNSDLAKDRLCRMQITVGNVLYIWKDAKVVSAASQNSHLFEILVTSRPKIKNRRKYPRMDISNKCKIFVEETGKEIDGQLDNISANGFALLTKESYFKENKGAKIKITIEDFDLPKHNVLEGKVIRCSENEGVFIVGCQMPEDDNEIREYVNNSI